MPLMLVTTYYEVHRAHTSAPLGGPGIYMPMTPQNEVEYSEGAPTAIAAVNALMWMQTGRTTKEGDELVHAFINGIALTIKREDVEQLAMVFGLWDGAAAENLKGVSTGEDVQP